jgi:L-ascorbate metabolism protein UlaG (beta-lactamase superfamily)
VCHGVGVRRLLLGTLAAVFVVSSLGAGWLAWRLHDRPDIERWAGLRLVPTPGGPAGGVTVTFLGVTTLLVTDGETALMTDGFFTRPSLLRTLAGRIAPDPEAIGRALARAGVERLAAVVVVHSHYDHAMDAPEVARRTGAVLVGSESTANVGRGWGLAEDRIRVATPGEPMRFGAFEVTLIPSRHFPHGMAMGEITKPLVPPARAMDYLEGGSWSVVIAHPAGRLLVQGSAGWEDGALRDQRADVVLLGVAGLGSKGPEYTRRYLEEVVEPTGASLVIPIHWDDFSRPLDEPLVPLPNLLDDFAGTMDLLTADVASHPGRRLAFLPVWEPVRLLPPLRR